jgi:hypothetical protein
MQLTRKLFATPDLPDNLREKRRRATSNAHLRGVDYAWRGGRHWPTILSHGLRAGLTDPTNIRNLIRRLTPYLVAGTRLGRLAYILRRGLRMYRLPGRAIRKLRRAVLGLDRPSILNLMGDRDVEWSWIASMMPAAGSRALDFGSGGSHLSLLAAERGFDVTALDLLPVDWSYVHPKLRAIQSDLFDVPLPKGHFDLVINCSTVEHVGLVGR